MSGSSRPILRAIRSGPEPMAGRAETRATRSSRPLMAATSSPAIPSPLVQADVYLIKTNAQGDTLWTRTYGGAVSDMGYSVQQTPDGGYIVAGYTDSFGAGGADVYLIKTNASGDTLWTRTYGGPSYDEGYSVRRPLMAATSSRALPHPSVQGHQMSISSRLMLKAIRSGPEPMAGPRGD